MKLIEAFMLTVIYNVGKIERRQKNVFSLFSDSLSYTHLGRRKPFNCLFSNTCNFDDLSITGNFIVFWSLGCEYIIA